MKEYVREYFDRHAERWVEAAYAGGTRFPIGPERVRLAIEGVAEAVSEGGSLVDLGCGGGQLCLVGAELGWRVTGVDAAPAMIEEARVLCEGQSVELVVGSFDESGLPDGSVDAVTALGLIEYLPEDGPLFAEAKRLLRSGGRFAVSCRNRLYNLMSANRYTARELAHGEAAVLLAELEERLGRIGAEEVRALAEALAPDAPELAEAARADAEGVAGGLHDHATSFAADRRQHTPSRLETSARIAGFRPVATLALHPHPLHPNAERLAPRAYNQIALAWQRPLERSPLGLAVSSAFVAVFEA